MKIVIDIPQEIYEMCVKYHQKDYFNNPDSIIRTAIAHSSSLQRTGRWIANGETFRCSECGELVCCQGRYCNECGAMMQEVEG